MVYLVVEDTSKYVRTARYLSKAGIKFKPKMKHYGDENDPTLMILFLKQNTFQNYNMIQFTPHVKDLEKGFEIRKGTESWEILSNISRIVKAKDFIDGVGNSIEYYQELIN